MILIIHAGATVSLNPTLPFPSLYLSPATHVPLDRSPFPLFSLFFWGGFSQLKIPIDKRGLVAACNQGKNTNTSQFFFSLGAAPKLTGKHVVFGEITEGIEVL